MLKNNFVIVKQIPGKNHWISKALDIAKRAGVLLGIIPFYTFLLNMTPILLFPCHLGKEVENIINYRTNHNVSVTSQRTFTNILFVVSFLFNMERRILNYFCLLAIAQVIRSTNTHYSNAFSMRITTWHGLQDFSECLVNGAIALPEWPLETLKRTK